MTNPGSAMFGAQWKTMEAKIIEVPPIPEHLPGYNSAYDIAPHAGEAAIRRFQMAGNPGHGFACTPRRRTRLLHLVPQQPDNPRENRRFDTTGAKAVLTVAVDDYAEIWVNGQMPRAVGVPSPATIQGFNMPNRVVLSNSVRPGDKFQIAVFGVNGPISVAPANTVWFREARIQFYK